MSRALRLWLLTLMLWLPQVQAAQPGFPTVSRDELPAEARHTLQAIEHNGPFAYERDGVVFGNYERKLPKQRKGYYHEYTVKTPGSKNRGTRRIVCGKPVECYYTADHYKTFRRIQD